MSKYTLIDNPRVDFVIEQELNIIVRGLVDILGDFIQAILLTGGFGRGEGAVVKENEQYRPVNDYDILVVLKSWGAVQQDVENKIFLLENELNQSLRVKQVDLGLIQPWKLAIPAPSIARYEIKQGHKILYGKLPFGIRSFASKLIPMHEATKYFRTRGSGLIIARVLLDEDIFHAKEKLELAFLEINKAFLALGDAYLIGNRCYQYSYVARRDILLERKTEFKIPVNIAEGYAEAIENKIQPDFKDLNNELVEKRWSVAATAFISEFLKFESNRFKIEFTSLGGYDHFVIERQSKVPSPLRKSFHLFNKEDYSEFLRHRLVVMYLLQATIRGEDDALARAAQLLGVPVLEDGNWTHLAFRYLQEWHPGGIVRNILNRRV